VSGKDELYEDQQTLPPELEENKVELLCQESGSGNHMRGYGVDTE